MTELDFLAIDALHLLFVSVLNQQVPERQGSYVECSHYKGHDGRPFPLLVQLSLSTLGLSAPLLTLILLLYFFMTL